jgi:omega-6 fatty acid desaturase (delta-12 desaturase)
VSPIDSPRPSASSTSLSSLASDDAPAPKQYGKLLDTYGNEFKVPDFTIKDIRDAIPKHCYERSAVRSLGYVVRDMVYLATTFYLWNKFVTPEYVPSQPLRVVLWGVYTFLQGLFGTGLWVLAHECGHGAFSPSQKLNNFVGWVLHSALLVPYFSWQISHSKHHKATGNMERDMVFVPRTREQQASRIGRLVHELSELTEETPIFTFIHLVGQQLIGWWNYLLTNVTGHNNHERQREGRGKGKKNGWGGGVNHFDPRSPLYENRDAPYILLSDLGLAITISALVYLGKTFGWSNMFVWYFLPYIWVNHWLGKCRLREARLGNTDKEPSRHHVPAAHRPLAPPLHRGGVELCPRRGGHHRPRVRLHRAAPAARHHRDARAAPLRQLDPLLQRRRGHRGHQAHHGPALPLRHARGPRGLPQGHVAQRPLVPVGRADRGRRGPRQGRAVLPEPQRARDEAGQDGACCLIWERPAGDGSMMLLDWRCGYLMASAARTSHPLAGLLVVDR